MNLAVGHGGQRVEHPEGERVWRAAAVHWLARARCTAARTGPRSADRATATTSPKSGDRRSDARAAAQRCAVDGSARRQARRRAVPSAQAGDDRRCGRRTSTPCGWLRLADERCAQRIVGGDTRRASRSAATRRRDDRRLGGHRREEKDRNDAQHHAGPHWKKGRRAETPERGESPDGVGGACAAHAVAETRHEPTHDGGGDEKSGDEAEPSGLDADVEPRGGGRNLAIGQPDLAQAPAKPRPQQSEDRGHEPRPAPHRRRRPGRTCELVGERRHGERDRQLAIRARDVRTSSTTSARATLLPERERGDRLDEQPGPARPAGRGPRRTRGGRAPSDVPDAEPRVVPQHGDRRRARGTTKSGLGRSTLHRPTVGERTTRTSASVPRRRGPSTATLWPTTCRSALAVQRVTTALSPCPRSGPRSMHDAGSTGRIGAPGTTNGAAPVHVHAACPTSMAGSAGAERMRVRGAGDGRRGSECEKQRPHDADTMSSTVTAYRWRSSVASRRSRSSAVRCAMTSAMRRVHYGVEVGGRRRNRVVDAHHVHAERRRATAHSPTFRIASALANASPKIAAIWVWDFPRTTVPTGNESPRCRKQRVDGRWSDRADRH